MAKISMSAMIAALMIAGPAFAEDAPGTPAGYVRTGETSDCLRLASIQSSQILNERQILFTVAGGAWLQEPKNCTPLRKHYALSYTTSMSGLCTTDMITLIDGATPGSIVGSCSFEPFQKLEKTSASAD